MKSSLKKIQVAIYGCTDDLSQDKLNPFILSGQVEKREERREERIAIKIKVS